MYRTLRPWKTWIWKLEIFPGMAIAASKNANMPDMWILTLKYCMIYTHLSIYQISWRYLNIWIWTIRYLFDVSTQNSYISTNTRNIYILLKYYDMKYAYHSYLCAKFHEDTLIFGSRQYLKCHTLNSYNSTTNKNIHIPVTYYDMKYLCLYVYWFSWGYPYIWILNILKKHDKIICTGIWWLTPEKSLSFEKWIRQERTHPRDHSPLKSDYVKTLKRPFPMCKELQRKRSEYDSQCILLCTNTRRTEIGQWVPNTVNFLQLKHQEAKLEKLSQGSDYY